MQRACSPSRFSLSVLILCLALGASCNSFGFGGGGHKLKKPKKPKLTAAQILQRLFDRIWDASGGPFNNFANAAENWRSAAQRWEDKEGTLTDKFLSIENQLTKAFTPLPEKYLEAVKAAEQTFKNSLQATQQISERQSQVQLNKLIAAQDAPISTILTSTKDVVAARTGAQVDFATLSFKTPAQKAQARAAIAQMCARAAPENFHLQPGQQNQVMRQRSLTAIRRVAHNQLRCQIASNIIAEHIGDGDKPSQAEQTLLDIKRLTSSHEDYI